MTGQELKNELVNRGLTYLKYQDKAVRGLVFMTYYMMYGTLPVAIYTLSGEGMDMIAFVETNNSGGFEWRDDEMANPQFIDKYVKFLKEYKVNQTIKEMEVDFD